MPTIFHLDDPDFFTHGPAWAEWVRIGTEALGMKISNFVLGDSDDREAPVASLLFLPPGHRLPRHAHNCYRAEVIVRGSLHVGDTVLHPGDVSFSAPHEAYGPHVAGPTGSLSVEIFSKAAAILAEPDPAGPQPEDLAEMKVFESAVLAWRQENGVVDDARAPAHQFEESYGAGTGRAER
jgi:hypothetical protein